MSPTFEEVIILWCLEKIDNRLPNLVNLAFGHKLVDNLTLKDLQEEIFAKLPQILADNNIEINSSSEKKLKLKEEGKHYYYDISLLLCMFDINKTFDVCCTLRSSP